MPTLRSRRRSVVHVVLALAGAAALAGCARAEDVGIPIPVDPSRPASGDANIGGDSDGPDDEPGDGPAGRPGERPGDGGSAEPDGGDAPDEDGGVPDAAPPDGSSSDASVPDAPIVTPPALDGVVSPGEYGLHTEGKNVASTPRGQRWFMTWDATALYVAVQAATVDEGVVLYVGASGAEASGGPGVRAGQEYDATKLGTLPFPAVLVVYAKRSYQEARPAVAGAWGAPVAGAVTIAVGPGDTREIRVPWSAAGLSRRPPGFAWLGYATSAKGDVYSTVPSRNPIGVIGRSATFPAFYAVADATPGSGTKPFERIEAP